MANNDFNMFVGSQNGYFKGINLNTKSIVMKNFSKDKSCSTANQQITALSWVDPQQEEIMVGFQHQQIAIFNTASNCFTSSYSERFGEGSLVSALQTPEYIITGLSSGEVRLHKSNKSTIINTFARFYEDKYTKRPTLACIKLDPLNASRFATGGCENDLAIWDMNNLTAPIFRARNVKNDMLQLRVPIWISDLTYLPNSHLIAIVSRHKHLRLYDDRTQRKPVVSFEWSNHPSTCISAVPSADKQVIVGNSYGRLTSFDLKKVKQSPLTAYKGFIGAVRSVTVSEKSPLVLSISLDRFLRVHHLETGNIIYKHFLKSRPNSLLVRKDLNDEDFGLINKNLKQNESSKSAKAKKSKSHKKTT